MLRTAKKEILFGGAATVWPLLLLVAALFLTETRLWKFTPAFPDIVGQISFAAAVSIEENHNARQNIASDSYFDPEVEFLEVGVKVNDGPVTWKAYGVDKPKNGDGEFKNGTSC